jgi:hypothetical protein
LGQGYEPQALLILKRLTKGNSTLILDLSDLYQKTLLRAKGSFANNLQS